jgi:hypothetical protein
MCVLGGGGSRSAVFVGSMMCVLGDIYYITISKALCVMIEWIRGFHGCGVMALQRR